MNTNVGSDTPRNEPPEDTPCYFCDGQGKVIIHSIIISNGLVKEWTPEWRGGDALKCPRCDGSGVEPISDNYRR